MTDITIDQWSPLKKILFRFALVYFALFILIENDGAFPLWDIIMSYPEQWLQMFIPWVGKNILHLPYEITTFTNGSGDTTYDYVIIFCIFSIAAISCTIWSLTDRNRQNYSELYYWLTVAIRFYVGLLLVNYGLYKIFKLQFPYPNLYRLTQTYGASSPMGLAWTFLGFSNGYNLFMGIAEVAAILLLFRRTMTLGGIITLMTTANVMAVNYFYDVPVKILSTNLVLMTLFLLLHDAEVMWKFFFKGEMVRLSVITPPQFPKKWVRITGLSFKGLIIAYALVFGSIEIISAAKMYGDDAPKGKLNGVYHVKSFVLGKDSTAVLNTERWKAMYVDNDNYCKVQMMNDSSSWFMLKLDSVKHSIEFKSNKDTAQVYNFNYSSNNKNHFLLKGTKMSDSMKILFKKSDVKSSYRLTKRGFHWINEYPYNR